MVVVECSLAWVNQGEPQDCVQVYVCGYGVLSVFVVKRREASMLPKRHKQKVCAYAANLSSPFSPSRINLGGLLKVLHQLGHFVFIVLLDGAQSGSGRINAIQATGVGEDALQVRVLAGQRTGQ